jgi:hypothetical protein
VRQHCSPNVLYIYFTPSRTPFKPQCTISSSPYLCTCVRGTLSKRLLCRGECSTQSPPRRERGLLTRRVFRVAAKTLPQTFLWGLRTRLVCFAQSFPAPPRAARREPRYPFPRLCSILAATEAPRVLARTSQLPCPRRRDAFAAAIYPAHQGPRSPPLFFGAQ